MNHWEDFRRIGDMKHIVRNELQLAA